MNQSNEKESRRQGKKRQDEMNRHKEEIARDFLKAVCTFSLKHRLMTAWNIITKRYLYE